MKVGVRAHDYGKRSVEELAALLQKEGYESAQLAFPKAFQEIESYQDITLAFLHEVRKIFEKYEVDIAVFGCYMDLGNPNKDVRSQAVRTFCQCIAYAKEVGAKVIGSETAYPHLNTQEKEIWRPHMMDSIQRIMEEAQRVDMQVAMEPVYWHPLENLEVTLDVIRHVQDPKHLRLIFDASNLLEYPETVNQNEYWKEWLNHIGEYVDVLHIKDFSLGKDRSYQPEILGKGVIEYQAISDWLKKQKREIYLLREEMNPRFAKEDILFLRNGLKILR